MRTQACALTVLVAAAPCTMIRIQKARRFKHLKLLLRKQRLNNDGRNTQSPPARVERGLGRAAARGNGRQYGSLGDGGWPLGRGWQWVRGTGEREGYLF